MFDRDTQGQLVFRCPRCLDTWPVLPGLGTKRSPWVRTPSLPATQPASVLRDAIPSDPGCRLA